MSEKPQEQKPPEAVERPVHRPAPLAEANRTTLAKGEDTPQKNKTFIGITIPDKEE